MEKTCYRCGLTKPILSFSKHSGMKGGHLNKCKPCYVIDINAAKARRADFYAQYEKDRSKDPGRRARSAATRKKAELAHPERKKARRRLRTALFNGTVVQSPCWICGEHSEAHHPDYSAPLDVVWLCPTHHRAAHALVE